MRWKTTWLLFGLAVALFAFIMLVERRFWRPTSSAAEPLPRLTTFKASDITNILLRITNQLALKVERPNVSSIWRLTVPFQYPGHLHKIERVLQELEQTPTQAFIAPEELRANKRTIAEFGLDLPQATLTLVHNGQRTEIAFGNKTVTGDSIYAQIANRPGIFIVGADVFNQLPHSANEWRDTSLFGLVGAPPWNRIEFRAGSRSFALDMDDNKVFFLSKPTKARADPARFELLMRHLLGAQVRAFVNDNPRADLEPYGLQTPELEVAFAKGTNDLWVVQFGKSPTNDSSVIYARRTLHTNIVLVARSVLDDLQISHADLRDYRLVTFDPALVDSIEVVTLGGSAENFTVRRQADGNWIAGDPQSAPTDPAQPVPADPELMRDWLALLVSLQGTVESDVVTDFSTLYNLAPPARQYLLKSAVTNAAGSVSNRIIAELDLGARQGDKVFARRPDEPSAYSLPLTNVTRLPHAAWQLRDRRVWSFTTNQVNRLSVMYRGQTNVLQRNSGNQWTILSGSNVIVNNPIGFSARLDELMVRLGELRVEAWIARGEESREPYGFDAPGSRLSIELKNGEGPKILTLEFGSPSPSGLPYALAVNEGATWIFEFPKTPYFLLVRDLISPLFRQP